MRVYDISEKLDAAIRGDSDAAADVWRAIAKGEAAPIQALEWVTNVANMVVIKVLDPGSAEKRKGTAALQAIGLDSPLDKNKELKETIEMYLEGEPDVPRDDLVWVAHLLVSGFPDITDPIKKRSAAQRVDRIVEKIKLKKN